jgi:acetyltransferase-like isoleucine patch superfamily enzyme
MLASVPAPRLAAMPSSPARRAIGLLRRTALQTRRLLARADAIEHARRSLELPEDGSSPAAAEETRGYLADGTLVMGRGSAHAPIVRKFKGDTGRIVIGDFVSIARGVEFYSGGLHRTEWVSQYGLRAMLDLPGAYEDGFPFGNGDIHVGPDVSIAQGAVVMSGVTIGAGAVVLTRAVVTRDVPAYAIVGGVPAKETGTRFGEDQVAALLRIAWWDWPLDTIEERVGELSQPDLDAFIARYDPGPGGGSH